ncbi:SO2930 family diheme c-type cytochrome [Cecembia calidifontis]|uniref:Putative repeat protein (TIGR03806 family) n=1 Tax=Cecembia calidifontis TaxID=1187080 RepID=A0A4Q7PDG3_9BACT|nr:SO2930 family diheme c-type cytochrome [Cecembia calidifontis]RZS98406.1 putative repeat protein (TIGR03806 family) [Cecembia calidifontis]
MWNKSAFLFFSVCIVTLLGCSSKEPIQEVLWDASQIRDIELPPKKIQEISLDAIPFEKLSDYGLFQGILRNLEPNEGVLPYEPASSLFTDYAFKSRFIWMPKGSSAFINNDTEGTIEFPDNTILIKNFYYPIDFSEPENVKRIVETRLMVKQNGAWEAYPYIWKDDQSDAIYKVAGAEKTVHWKDKNGDQQVINYLVPNKNQCKSCHNSHETMTPIGVKTKHLNHAIEFGDGKKNQLVKWQEYGYLKELKELSLYPVMANYQDEKIDLELRAKAYLDINCGHCHRQEGPASTSGLFLNYEETDPLRLGIYKTPVAAGFGAGSFKFDIVPGKANESILTYRMETNKVGAAMPEIGRVTTHQEGLALIKDWINAMKP